MDLGPFWKTIVDTLQDGLLVIDPWGRILAANPAAESLTGYSSEELLGHSCRILNCTGCKIIGKGEGAAWCKIFSVGSVKAKKCTITNKDQRTVHILKSASVLRDARGGIIAAVETLTDMSVVVRQQQEIENLRKTFHLDDGYHGLLGKSQSMQQLFEMVENVAQTDAPVLIQGQSGTGKELVAHAIHDASVRSCRPFIKVNCAALNENLLESELFGHEKGAFTGADRTRIGRFEAAHGGTIFLDEVGDIPLPTQVKLLRVLEERKIERVGDHKPIPIDVRIITATNRSLDRLIAGGAFREDFFFRINVFPLRCPTLKERLEDLPILVQHFIKLNSLKSEKKILGFTPEALERLSEYAWPGNIRELRNTIEYAFVLCPGGAIDVKHLPPQITAAKRQAAVNPVRDPAFHLEREKLLEALMQVNGNQSRAARLLGVSRMTIWKRVKKYNIDIEADVIRA